MLYVESGRLMIDGEPCREVGFNAYYEFLKTLLDNNDTSYVASLDKLQEYGIRVIRCMITPFWPGGAGGWSVYDTAGGLNSTYYDLLDAFMDACAARDIQIVIPLFWRHASLPDLFSETVNQMGTAGSASLTYAVSVATEMATRYKDHAACGMWQVGNEWTNYGKSGALPTTSVSNGTPASYSAPNDVLTKEQCQYAVEQITNALRAVDPDRAIIAAVGRLSANATTNPQTLLGTAIAHGSYDTGATDCYGLHIYTGSEFDTAALYALREYCSVVRQAAGSKPVVLDEIGVSEEDATIDGTWPAIAALLSDPAAPELTLLWNWGDLNTYGSGDTRWDVFPGVNREYQADAVRTVQSRGIGCSYATGREFVPRSYCRFRGGASTPDCLYFASGLVSAYDSWTITFWERYLGPHTSTGNFWRLLSFGDESSYGFMVLRNSGSGRSYAQVQMASGAVNTHGKQPISDHMRWLHHAVSWDATNQKLRHICDGWYTATEVSHATTYIKGGDRRFVIGANTSLADGSFMDLFDLRYYDSVLSLSDVWSTKVNRAASVDPIFRVLYDGIDEGLTVQWAPVWTDDRQVDTDVSLTLDTTMAKASFLYNAVAD